VTESKCALIGTSKGMQILFFVGELNTGGTERQIAVLANGLARLGHNVIVATICSGGQYWEWLLEQHKVKLMSLYEGRSANWPRTIKICMAAFRLNRLIAGECVSVVYSVLNPGNLIAWFASIRVRKASLIWGCRASNTYLNWVDIAAFKLCKILSFSVPLLIANSQAGLAFYENKGYKAKKHMVIPNGIDTVQFNYFEEERKRIRTEWGITGDEKLIGFIGRLDPLKGHSIFLQAAARLVAMRKDVYFVCVGGGNPEYRDELVKLTKTLGLVGRVHWIGERNDIPGIYSALDIATLASLSEGFSNSLGEAMACRIPSVVTNVGDSAWIVSDCGLVVEPKDPEQLASAWFQILSLNKLQYDTLGRKARKRIETLFSVEALVSATENALNSLVVK
jgi:glycosyltransferase involved in cell wall biosynthesis